MKKEEEQQEEETAAVAAATATTNVHQTWFSKLSTRVVARREPNKTTVIVYPLSGPCIRNQPHCPIKKTPPTACSQYLLQLHCFPTSKKKISMFVCIAKQLHCSISCIYARPWVFMDLSFESQLLFLILLRLCDLIKASLQQGYMFPLNVPRVDCVTVSLND